MRVILTEVLSIESMESELMLKALATVRLFLMSLLLLDASFGEPCEKENNLKFFMYFLCTCTSRSYCKKTIPPRLHIVSVIVNINVNLWSSHGCSTCVGDNRRWIVVKRR